MLNPDAKLKSGIFDKEKLEMACPPNFLILMKFYVVCLRVKI